MNDDEEEEEEEEDDENDTEFYERGGGEAVSFEKKFIFQSQSGHWIDSEIDVTKASQKMIEKVFAFFPFFRSSLTHLNSQQLGTELETTARILSEVSLRR
jgi:hypothetical protein